MPLIYEMEFYNAILRVFLLILLTFDYLRDLTIADVFSCTDMLRIYLLIYLYDDDST